MISLVTSLQQPGARNIRHKLVTYQLKPILQQTEQIEIRNIFFNISKYKDDNNLLLFLNRVKSLLLSDQVTVLIYGSELTYSREKFVAKSVCFLSGVQILLTANQIK